MADYRNLYWTRLMQVEGFEPSMETDGDHQPYRWPLGPDIVEECSAVAAMPAVDPDDWVPLFEPNDFVEANGLLEIEQYRLPSEDLQTWADRAVRLRASIAERASEVEVRAASDAQSNGLVGRAPRARTLYRGMLPLDVGLDLPPREHRANPDPDGPR